MRKVKILLVSTTSFARKEGISTVILDYFGRFDKNCFQIDVAAAGVCCEQLEKEFAQNGIAVRYLPSRRKKTLSYLRALHRLFAKERYDAIYVHGSSAIMSMELCIAWLCGCQVRAVHSHNTTCRQKKADRLLRPFFYALYTDAFACGLDAGKWLYGNRPFRIVKNGRDVEKYRFDPTIRKKVRGTLGLKDETLSIGHVGNFNVQKNQSYLLDVLQQVLTYRPDAKLYLMGDGEKRNEVRQKAEAAGLEDSVVFTGSIGNVEEMLQAMDVMLLPSLHEGLPLVAIEWQIAGLPCILSDTVTRECSFTEQVRFMPLSVGHKEWAKAIMELVSRDRAADAQTAMKLAAEKGYDIDKNAAELQAFFAERCRGGKKE